MLAAGSVNPMPQSTAALLMKQRESVLVDVEALCLHIAAEELWETPVQRDTISSLLARYEALADELRLAIAAFR